MGASYGSKSFPRWQLLGLVSAAAVLRVGRARAVDPFEIQVYDGTANAPGEPGLELHLNTVPSGVRKAEPPELAAHQQSHFTLEPSLGVRPWWELGAYFQTALTGDGSFRYAGVKRRSKFVTPPEFDRHSRLAVGVEYFADSAPSPARSRCVDKCTACSKPSICSPFPTSNSMPELARA